MAERKNEEIIDKARYQSSLYANNNWIVKHSQEDYANEINKIVYAKMDEMIEHAEATETKIMLLEKKNKMLQEDLKNKKAIILRDRIKRSLSFYSFS